MGFYYNNIFKTAFNKHKSVNCGGKTFEIKKYEHAIKQVT